ncbi:AraC family transcriptional regulator of adaptative response / DNA-3-methyladenine glycosylase II [Leifsonia shinshuensis]|nr:AraC family transcriptional regulator of adaptative response / DNA-3-methyladenine glycosylase II [Leifsonia shinshuensis]
MSTIEKPASHPAPRRVAAPRARSADPLGDPVFAERYRAMSARDARFDGQFVTGVHTTGIYCRPSCPAVTPKPGNVSFYLTAAAAHEAGLRACKRCLPDAVPGSPEWNIRDDLAARAMRLIADGTVEREGVPGLARRLGYTTRHLTRVLTAELGAGPLALARAHRAQTARLLLTGSDLPITDVAFAAGFRSVRQFNETIAEVYRLTPGALRASARRGTAVAPHPGQGAVSISLRLPARPPFDGASLIAFLTARAIDGVEAATGGDDAPGYARALRLPHGPAVVRLTPTGSPEAPAVQCDAALADVADLAPLVARVRRLLDLDADAAAIDAALASDPALAPSVAATPGLRLPGAVDAEEIVFRALIGQQVSVAAARTALTRLTEALGEPVALTLPGAPALGAGSGFTRLFPTPSAIAEGGREVLRGPARRIDAIVGAAEKLADGSLRIDVGESREDLEARLLALPGVGPWTAGYIALRVLGSPDVLLTGDLALRQGAERLGLPSEPRALEAYGARWAPWRSYAGMHLWRA